MVGRGANDMTLLIVRGFEPVGDMMDCGFPAGLVFVVFGLAVEAGMSSTATGIVDVVP
jgi:hypothetical protein